MRVTTTAAQVGGVAKHRINRHCSLRIVPRHAKGYVVEQPLLGRDPNECAKYNSPTM